MKVEERVIERRVRRAVARDGQVLRKTRPGQTRARADCGDYYTVDPETNGLVRSHCELDELAAEYRVLHPGEVIAQ